MIPIVGYSKEKDTAIIKFSEASQAISYPEGATYHFGTKSWVFLTQGAFAGNTDNSNSGAISNMITNSEGDVLFYRFQSGENASTATTAYNSIKNILLNQPIILQMEMALKYLLLQRRILHLEI